MHNGKVFQQHIEETEQNSQNLQNQNLQNQNLQNQNLQQRKTKQKKKKENVVKPCNCRGGIRNCPLAGRCKIEKSVVYTCKVTRLDDQTSETYTGLTDNTFKQRFYGHNHDFTKRKNRNKTMLSKYIWYLKENNIPYDLSWRILG